MTSTPRVRMSPDTRREQLLELGVEVLSTRSLEELSIDLLAEEAGISRGLLYHYFGNKQEFHEAVVRRAVEDLYALTAPVGDLDSGSELTGSVDRYVAYVEANHRAYLSIVRAAHSGNEAMREIYESARNALTDRIFESVTPEDLAALGIADTPGVRLLVRGWSALVERVVLEWIERPGDIAREQLTGSLTASLVAVAVSAP